MQTYHLHFSGQVQGVGFRPFVQRLANRMGLTGRVSNDNDGVHIEVNASATKLEHFVAAVLTQKPRMAKITGHNVRQVAFRTFSRFEIAVSQAQATPNLLITPDMAACAECELELFDPQSRRFHYPFLSCTNCGVRYSVITQLPYDRAHTTMHAFEPCTSCREEYHDMEHRLCHSQTQSCVACGVELRVWENDSLQEINSPDAVQLVVKAWQSGKIVAIKGVGGYLLTCDAAQRETINTLRRRKNRPSKPFAVMFPDLPALDQVAIATPEAAALLQSPQRPIVLLPLRENVSDNIFAHTAITPGLANIGVMLPYMPLFMLLCKAFGKPIVATSANISHSPIIADDDIACRELPAIADLIISHNRAIVAPQDDSVARLDDEQQPIWLRRSRGLAPGVFHTHITPTPTRTLAMGAMLKSTFALAVQPYLYVSQYLGDLESYETQERYKATIEHFFRLFQTQPEQIVVDKHPDYFATRWGKMWAHRLNIPLFEVQHHTAHFAAVLAENNLLNTQEPVLGVVFDGTGLGEDGQIWGGELFLYAEQTMQRVGHLPYFPAILGDKMAREPRIAALCAFRRCESPDDRLYSKFTPAEWQIYQQRLAQPSLHTSSAGRLFDAMASWLGLADKISYEGEAALLLESVAEQFYRKNPGTTSAFSEDTSWDALLTEVIHDSLSDKPAGFVALKFHYALAVWIKTQAQHLTVRHIAFSGGVFQNQLLVHLVKKELAPDFRLYFHQQLPANDENIAFGQLILGQQHHNIQPTSKQYVFSNSR